MFIYEIFNTVNGKRYVGQTTAVDPSHRWKAHIYDLKRNRHPNPHLQHAWNKDGEESFVFDVLEVCATEEALNEAEIRFITKFQSSDRKFGYNILAGGKNGNHKKGRAIRSLSLRPEGYPVVVDPNGIEHRISSLREFARLHGLTQFGLRQVVVTQKYFHYKGWRLSSSSTIGIPFNDDDKSERGKRISSSRLAFRYPDVISPDGTTYSVEHLSDFCKKHQLSKGNMSMLLRGKREIYKGWTLAR